MLKIRLQRIGRRHDPQFRVVVTEHTSAPKSGNFIEIVGTYNAKSGDLSLKADRIEHWLSVGAQPSDTVRNFLIDQKILSGKKVNVLPRKSPIVKEGGEDDAAAKATDTAESTPAESGDATEEAVPDSTPEEGIEPQQVESTEEPTPAEAAPAPETQEEKTTQESPVSPAESSEDSSDEPAEDKSAE